MTFYSVRLPKFELLTPRTVAEAADLLASHGEKTAIVAGGTDLIPAMRKRERTPEFVLSLRGVPGLDRIEQRDGQTVLGPLVTLNQVKDSSVIRDSYCVLAEAADRFANNQVRNMATVAGNLCNSSCCADTSSPLIVLGAQVKLKSSKGERTVPVEKLCQTVFKPTLRKDELLTEISIPKPAPNTVGTYLKYTLPGATGYSFVGVAATLTVEGKLCRDARIALVASSQCWLREGCLYECPFPFHATEAEAALKGKGRDDGAIQKAADVAAQTAHPMVNTDYTREMIKVFTRRALLQAWDKAKERGLA
ncbi:MAG: xanthine dehydrogenase family protein subunit M [Chloroflexi bacterium]|nr:xanthine dehydrogenase family protein subunit M [Chloroflexota bacterium]